MDTPTTVELQRGKRRTAFRTELVALGVLALAILDYGGTSDVFVITFPALLTYAAALRGLDAKFK